MSHYRDSFSKEWSQTQGHLLIIYMFNILYIVVNVKTKNYVESLNGHNWASTNHFAYKHINGSTSEALFGLFMA